tara:strand:- start:149 stop:442 length:294 start_codon:yes stop_codon:yes gene_type:complete
MNILNLIQKLKGKIMVTIKITKRDAIALLGIILIQGALLPSHISGNFPDITLPIFIFLGLLCYMYKAILDNDYVYILSNSIGLILNGSMIIRILTGA